MANSSYQYVRNFEAPNPLPLSNWIVVRIDGRAFSKLCNKYAFQKPNDQRCIDLMNASAIEVVKALHDVVLAYGQSDEYSFVFHEDATLFERRAEKLATTVSSMFTAEFCVNWPVYFPEMPLERPLPSFDGRCVCYPKRKILRDYLAWRQVDCHINNLYNTSFWALVLKGGIGRREAEEELKGTVSGDKNEILFSRFGINYNDEPEVWKKGTVVYRAYDQGDGGKKDGGNIKVGDPTSRNQMEKDKKRKMKARIAVEHVDIIGNGFWEARPYILGGKSGDGD